MIDLVSTKSTYGNTLVELGDKNSDIFVVEADLMKASGSDSFRDKYPNRHINVGIAEQNLVGVAAGLAAMGRIPYASTFANFMSQRAADQVMMSVAYNKFNVKLVGTYAGLTSEKNGGTHISVLDLAMMRCLPNMTVIVPGDTIELTQVIIAVSETMDPTYIRMARSIAKSLFDTSHNFEIGNGYQFDSGKDVTLISTGITTNIAFDALKVLKGERINPRLIHLPTLKPADADLIIKCAKETGAIITIENHSIYGGLGSLVSEIVTKEYPVPVFSIGINDKFGLTAKLDFQLKYFGITIENIISRVKEIIKLK